MLEGIYKVSEKFMKGIAILLTGLFCVSSFLLTAKNDSLSGYNFTLEWDNVLVNLGAIDLVIIFGFLLYYIMRRNTTKGLKVYMWVVVVWTLFVCEYLVFFLRVIPSGDSLEIYKTALAFSKGSFGLIKQQDSFISLHPFQMGICIFLSLLLKVIHLFKESVPDYRILMALYGVMEAATVFFMYKTVKNLYENDRIRYIFLLISSLNLPYMMYSCFLYGEVPSIFFFSIGAYFLTELFTRKQKKVANITGCVIAFSLATWVRMNTLVLIIGIAIVLILECFRTKKVRLVVTALLICATSFVVMPLTIKIVEFSSGYTVYGGVTPISYVATGIQDNSTEHNKGWDNGYQEQVLITNDFNRKLADEKSLSVISSREDMLWSNPSNAFHFYRSKYLTQWVEPTYYSLESTYNHEVVKRDIVDKIYEGEYKEKYIFFCDILQIMIFLGSFHWAITSCRKGRDNNLWKSFMFVGVFGGFLIQQMWVGSSQAILTYAFLLIPYAACGTGNIINGIRALK